MKVALELFHYLNQDLVVFEEMRGNRCVIARDDWFAFCLKPIFSHPRAEFADVFIKIGLLKWARETDSRNSLRWVLNKLHALIIGDWDRIECVFGWDEKRNRVSAFARDRHRCGHGNLLAMGLGGDWSGHCYFLAAGIAAEDVVGERTKTDAGCITRILCLDHHLGGDIRIITADLERAVFLLYLISWFFYCHMIIITADYIKARRVLDGNGWGSVRDRQTSFCERNINESFTHDFM